MTLWAKELKGCADPERAAHFIELLAGTRADLSKLSEERVRILAALFSGSQTMSNLLIAHPASAESLTPELLKFPRRKQGLGNELSERVLPHWKAQDYRAALASVRTFKQREMLRIATRDLARLGRMSEITHEISDLADVCLDAVWRICVLQTMSRYGRPFHQDPSGKWHPTAACVLGMGKLGGQELNYSSDVDLLMVYSEEGAAFREPPAQRKGPKPILSNHQFFNRLAEAFIAEITRMAPEGVLYRIDMRLRPEGDSGPLSRSLASYENYYAQWGQTWERMMLIKARGVAGDDGLATEFLEMVQPFRYPRSVSPGVLREVAAMKDRIENEVVKAGELERNVKLGRGGIREIEFIVQSRQLLHAGRQPFLQGAQTLPCLEKLVQYELLEPGQARVLTEAYGFLRDVEHRLQMEDNLQTHTIPLQRKAQERLARLMGFQSVHSFESARKAHTSGVRSIFEKLLKGEAKEAEAQPAFPRDFESSPAPWKEILARHRFRDLDRALKVLREFVEGPGYVHVSPRTSELAFGLVKRLLALCPQTASGPLPQPAEVPESSGSGPLMPGAARNAPLSDPDRVLTRLDSFIAAYGARSTLFELWNSNPAIFELLVLLFDRSEFLAELAIRTPDLVDELVTSGRLRQRKMAEETLRDLLHGIEDKDQHLWLRRYHQAELMRIGLRDILGLADPEQYLAELSALADACLRYALEVVTRKSRLKTAPFAVIGLGKLGGREIDYGSDLDLLFVAAPKAKNLLKLKQLALQFMDLLSARTEQGIVFHTDARLRPDGEKGLLVNTLNAYEEYYRQRAQLWEIQSLTRTRAVAGNAAVGATFQDLAGRLSNFSHPDLPLAAYSPEWKAKIHAMRLRIQNERTPRGKDALAIKTGTGGLMDAEFIAQALCLQNAWYEPNTHAALQRGREAGVLAKADQLIANYRKLRRIEGVLRRWSYEGEIVLPDDPAPYYRVSVRCGFPTPEAFSEFLTECRKAIREVYNEFFRL